jgi:hypothetical protein
MNIRPFRDDASAWNCVTKASQDTQSFIVMFHKGTLEFREALSNEVRQMRKDLQIAITEGGRVAFDAALVKWSNHSMVQHFITRLNRHLSAAPTPKRRGQREFYYEG